MSVPRPSAIVYDLAGRPPQATERLAEPSRCRICAAHIAEGQKYERWQGSKFTDQDKLRFVDGTHVCAACIWVHAWNAPPGIAAKSGSKRGPNLRLYSHLYDERGYMALNKADKAMMRNWICAPKHGSWFAAIADSGQKHVLPWAVVNPNPDVGVVRFEERDVRIDRGFADLCAHTCDLLTAGARKSEVETGQYAPKTWQAIEEPIRRFERKYGCLRGSGEFALSLWLSQRQEQGGTDG